MGGIHVENHAALITYACLPLFSAGYVPSNALTGIAIALYSIVTGILWIRELWRGARISYRLGGGVLANIRFTPQTGSVTAGTDGCSR